MEDFKIKIIDVKDGIKLSKNFPSLSYSFEFFKYREDKYNLKSGFLAGYKRDDLIFLLPINYSKNSFYSVYKDYTEPFTTSEFNEEILDNIISKLKGDLGFKKIEFNLAFLKNNNFIASNSKLSVFVLDINEKHDRESMFKKFKKKTRNEIRKSEKFGFDLRIEEIKNIDEIYELYSANMKRHGTPLRPKSYFEDLFNYYGEKCKAIMVYDKDKLAGVNIVFIKDNYLRLQYNYSDTKYWPHCVNNFLYYKMIKWGSEHGIRYFDFGPSSNTDKSNIHFKKGYGAMEVPIIKINKSSKVVKIKEWINQKKYNLKIRINKIKSIKS